MAMTHSGAQLIAETVKRLGIDVVFGIVGIPVVDVAEELIKRDMKFISFRNEQAASYAASAYGYLTGRPAVLLVVGGPGVVHACAGIFNSQANRWPLVVLAGSTSGAETYRGGFQELDQVSYLAPNVKFSCRPRETVQLPFLVQKGVRTSMAGVPGVAYVDLPADLIQDELSDADFAASLAQIDTAIMAHGPPRSVADPSAIAQAAELLRHATSPLVVVGKGAAYAGASAQVRRFVSEHAFAFLPTPMGKGVVDDDSELNIASARSLALKSADVVVLVGCRLNWILHHGDAPRFKDGAKFIQLDISAEDIGDNGASGSFGVGLVGDIGLTLAQLDAALRGYQAPAIGPALASNRDKNVASLAAKETDSGERLLNYNQVYKIVRESLAAFRDHVIYVTEGANTMDVARISFPSHEPKTRLDAGTNATMGVGMGYLIAAHIACPGKLVVAIEGDSAFGFSAMELETVARFKIPAVIVVMNNSGVYHGVDEKAYQGSSFKLPSTALGHNVRYDLLAESLGVAGIVCAGAEAVADAMRRAVANYRQGRATLVNVLIEPGTQKKLEFGWQSKKKSKL